MDVPVSERLRGVAVDEQLLNEIRALERVANARTIQFAANGRFPHWSVERWIAVLTCLCVVVGSIFMAGGRWMLVETSTQQLNELKFDVNGVRSQITSVSSDVERNRAQVDRRLDEIGAAVAQAVQEARNAARTTASMAYSLSTRSGRGGGGPH